MKDLDAKRLGEIFRGKRLLLGLSLDETSRRSGIKRETLAGYERGARSPSGKRILRLQMVLGIAADDLVGVDE